ncbi:type II toxin-antitoxin system RelE/ParE family toxin [Campylobacter taeniopygiae]|uniref:type II toxin-antitoxin system RelE/ParE family toxin n=1 Tax=Campylobacter taeniopygiae TaxID=2510188 RepID=UPI003D6A0AEC
MYEIVYYNNKITKFINNLELNYKEKAYKMIQELAINGNKLDEQHSKTRCDDIFKIRLKTPRHSIRIFYAFETKLFILHAYAKKDNATKNKDLEICVKRLKDIKRMLA